MEKVIPSEEIAIYYLSHRSVRLFESILLQPKDGKVLFFFPSFHVTYHFFINLSQIQLAIICMDVQGLSVWALKSKHWLDYWGGWRMTAKLNF